MKYLLLISLLAFWAPAAFACDHVGNLLATFDYYYGSETQKETARGEAQSYARKVHGVVVEETASFDVYACLD